MPKTKKTSKPKKLLNWLKPTSPAKGMLLFAIAFAVIGGSYMSFKSFAAGNLITHNYDQINNWGGAYTFTDCVKSKGCATVYVVTSPGGEIGSVFKKASTTSVKDCFTARTIGASTTVNFLVHQNYIPYSNYPNSTGATINVNTTGYTKYCISVPGNITYLTNQLIVVKGSNLLVASMSLEW